MQVSAPPACEAEARCFYGGVLGLELDKPPLLAGRGGVGTEERFHCFDPSGNRLEFLE